MSNPFKHTINLPPEQEAVRAKCFHPGGAFVEFEKEEIEQSIPSRFEKMVRKYPDRIAVKTCNHEFTYEALNKAGNRIARAILAGRGEGNEPIALLLENDAPMIAAILGALKAGKIYVPLDSSHPEAGSSYILEDSHAGLVVTNNSNLSLAKKIVKNAYPLLNIDELDSSLSAENVGLSISPDAPSQIRYTSGSTGQPKGVIHNHRKVLYNAMIKTNSFHICSEDRINAGTQHFHLPLFNGAILYLLDIKEQGVAPLSAGLTQNEITISIFVPSVFRHFLKTITGKKTFPNLRLIVLEGEQVSGGDVELYKKHFSPNCIFVNNLGSRETGSDCQYFIDKQTQITGANVPVGYAFQGKEILVLDDNGKEAGFNQIGEIAVKSRYLSLGYWRKPELTQAVFLPDPSGGKERIYHTGDLGLMHPDGCLEYLGRKDLQVKIRGYRVELTEIETLLLEFPGVKEAVVVARGDVSNETHLVAYIVAAQDPVPSNSELRESLRQKLPDYMVPSNFVVMDALPLLPNGKVDRRALPAPSQARPKLDTPFASPRTPVEDALTKIWAEVLDLDQVGIHDNFFDLGGHSLAATQVVSQVIKSFQLELPLRSLFQAPTVAEMAVVIIEHQKKRLTDEELERILTELEFMPEEEAKKLGVEHRKE